MLIPRTALLLTAFAHLCACGDGTQSATTPEPAPSTLEDPIITGAEVYREFCATCHDTGVGDAPVTGKPADWADRSQLWVAVLAQHVQSGYLEMPARGGASPLSNLSVTEAVEYMMLQTFPEKPAD